MPVVRTLGDLLVSALLLTLARAKPPSGMDFAKMMEQMKAAGVGGPEGAEGEGEADSSDDEGVSIALWLGDNLLCADLFFSLVFRSPLLSSRHRCFNPDDLPSADNSRSHTRSSRSTFSLLLGNSSYSVRSVAIIQISSLALMCRRLKEDRQFPYREMKKRVYDEQKRERV